MEEVIYIQLHDVDVHATDQDAQGQVTGIRVALPIDKAWKLLEQLAKVLHADGPATVFQWQREWLQKATCPDRCWN